MNKINWNKLFPEYTRNADWETNAKSIMHYLAKSNEFLKIMAKRIEEYDETLDLTLEQISTRLESYIEENDTLLSDRLEQWDLNLEKFPENVELLLQEWLTDGTLDHIINETIFSWKADKTYVDELNENVTTQLAQTNRKVASDFVNVAEFGAVDDYYLESGETNPTPTDNTQAFQEAFNTSRKVIIDGDGYYCSNQINLPHNVVIHGNHSKIIFEKDGFNLGTSTWNRPELYDLDIYGIDLAYEGRAIFSENGYVIYPKMDNIYIRHFNIGIDSIVLDDARSNFTWAEIGYLRIEHCVKPIRLKGGWSNDVNIDVLVLNFNKEELLFDTVQQFHSVVIKKLVLEQNGNDNKEKNSIVHFKNSGNGHVNIENAYIENNGYSRTATAFEKNNFITNGLKLTGKFYDSQSYVLGDEVYSEDTNKITLYDLGTQGIFLIENSPYLRLSIREVTAQENTLPLLSFSGSPNVNIVFESVFLFNRGYSYPNLRQVFVNHTPEHEVIVKTKNLNNDGGGSNFDYGNVIVQGDKFSNPTENHYATFQNMNDISLPSNIKTKIPLESSRTNRFLEVVSGETGKIQFNETGFYVFSYSYSFQRIRDNPVNIEFKKDISTQVGELIDVSTAGVKSGLFMLYLEKDDVVEFTMTNTSDSEQVLNGLVSNINLLTIKKI